MKSIVKGDDGIYRWIYEFSMLKNPIILLTIWKIFLYILLGMWVVFGLFLIHDAGGIIPAFISEAKALLLPAAILFVLSLVSYFILAGIYGWKYCVLFEMDEEGVRHIQMEKQFKKAQALGWLTAVAGMAAGRPGVVGSGLLTSTKNEMASKFGNVKKVKALKAFNTIKLDAPLNHNQVYTDKEDYAFVLGYISQRVPQEALRR